MSYRRTLWTIVDTEKGSLFERIIGQVSSICITDVHIIGVH